MSKISIQGAATGTGVFTLASPATNTDRVLTLPDEAGTVDTLQRAGNVLQVVSANYSTAVSISGSTYTDSGLSVSITPTSASSKILVLVNQMVYYYATSIGQLISGVRLLRDSTVILAPYADGTGPLEPYLEIGGSTEVYNSFRHSINYLDSPATTSAITYKTQGALRNTGSGRVLVFQPSNSTNGTSTITLMEIAA